MSSNQLPVNGHICITNRPSWYIVSVGHEECIYIKGERTGTKEGGPYSGIISAV